MNQNYQHLIGRDFKWESHDCFGLMRDFYNDCFGIVIPDFARPLDFWSKGMDLFNSEAIYAQGFRAIDVHPTQWQFGDVFLMAIESTTTNHCAILVDNNMVLHHMYNQLSKVEPYAGKHRNRTMSVQRHKDVKIENVEGEAQLLDLVPPHIRKKIHALREAHNIPE